MISVSSRLGTAVPLGSTSRSGVRRLTLPDPTSTARASEVKVLVIEPISNSVSGPGWEPSGKRTRPRPTISVSPAGS